MLWVIIAKIVCDCCCFIFLRSMFLHTWTFEVSCDCFILFTIFVVVVVVLLCACSDSVGVCLYITVGECVCVVFFSSLCCTIYCTEAKRIFIFHFIPIHSIRHIHTKANVTNRNRIEKKRLRAQRNRNQIRRKITTKFITIKKNLSCNCFVAFGASASK